MLVTRIHTHAYVYACECVCAGVWVCPLLTRLLSRWHVGDSHTHAYLHVCVCMWVYWSVDLSSLATTSLAGMLAPPFTRFIQVLTRDPQQVFLRNVAVPSVQHTTEAPIKACTGTRTWCVHVVVTSLLSSKVVK